MPKFPIQCGRATCRYALFGIAFGFCFPVIAITFDVVIFLGLKLSMESIRHIHQENPIHYIIDTAPIFLGIAFGVAGYFLDRARRLNKSLLLQTTILENANTNLKKALDDFHEAQELLIKSEKLASLGQLTAGIAHELKNPLNFITNFAESGFEIVDDLNNISSEEERKEVINMIKNNFRIINEHGIRTNNILQSMMTFARASNIEKRFADINHVCNDAADVAYHGFCSTIFGFKCEFIKEFSPELPKIFIRYEDISRVILNLLTNAFYAVNERRKKDGKEYIPVVELSTSMQLESDGKKNIIVKVRDNGTGMKESEVEQIFIPFFTTKPTGEGTGLGLSISHDIIMVHGGEMKVTSQLNSYTEFIVSLPVNVEDKIQADFASIAV